MNQDVLIAALIVTPLVLFGVGWLMWSTGKAVEREATALAGRLHCPRCGTNTLAWAEQTWMEETLYDDREEFFHGFVYRCAGCDGEFCFTSDGQLHSRATENLA
jgi:hypothetical protein